MTDIAKLDLPNIGPGDWKVNLIGRHFNDPRKAPDSPVRVAWRLGPQGPFRTEGFPSGVETTLTLHLSNSSRADPAARILHLQFPDAVFLPDTGIPDQRQLGFGLQRIEIARTAKSGT